MPAPILAVSGNIGAGKSTVLHWLDRQGAVCIDADQLARDVVQPGQPAYNEIVAHFGNDVLHTDGTLHREALGAVVFADEAQRRKLESITHPRIQQAMMLAIGAAQQTDTPLIVLEIPLLFEGGLDRQFQRSLLVTASDELRLQRILARDTLDETQVRDRMAAQMPQAEKRERARWVVDNDGDPEALEAQLQSLWPALTSAD